MGTRVIRRNQNRNRIKIIILIMMLFAGILLTTYIVTAIWVNTEPSEEFTGMEKHISKYAHISIDDATQIFQDINFHGYDSIFENEVLNCLQNLHDEYGLKVTLYVFGELDTFALWDFPDTYRQEFRANADWLKIGFHSITEASPEGESLTDFVDGFEKVNDTICRIAGKNSIAHVLRLHYWYATDEMVQALAQRGVTGLLCGDGEDVGYHLTDRQMRNLRLSRDGKITEGIRYYMTDIRLEKTENVESALEDRKNDRILVVFTHAWCFAENQDKMEKAVKWLYGHGYEFSFLED